MQWTSAPNIAGAPLPQRARGYWKARIGTAYEGLERLLEAERGQLPPWLAVGFGSGIAAWFALDLRIAWWGFLLFAAGLSVAGFSFIPGRAGRALGWFSLAALIGCSLVWVRAISVTSARLDRTMVTDVRGRIAHVDHLVAKGTVRISMVPDSPSLPRLVRVTVDARSAPAGLAAGGTIGLRARLTPPPPMILPGSYDFARDAWFKGIGAVGTALGPVTVLQPAQPAGFDRARRALRGHIAEAMPDRPAGIAIALATGDQNAVRLEDAEAMRRSGLTHLLSVSGLHIAAVVAAAMLLALRLLALSERIALRFNLVLVSAAVAAGAGIAYTLLTGAQVPTVRSCVAAVLVLVGIALGREAFTIRLIATGAIVVLAFRPESLAGASFQMSFAAVTAIVALHSTTWARRLFERRDEGFMRRLARGLIAMILTGLAVEFALVPLALYHFHKAGLYSVGANIIAIPLTTFVIMPLEAGALLLDSIGLGRPLWLLAELSIGALLDLAHHVGNARGAVAMLPSMPGWAFGSIIIGGLWLCLWSTRVRVFGLVPAALGAIGSAIAPAPDLLVTGDGRHLAVIEDDGRPLLLRDGAGDFVRTVFAESAGFDGDPGALGGRAYSDCSRDACVSVLSRGGRDWRLLATRSFQRLDWAVLTRACTDADIVVSDRKLPAGCTPRWLKLDGPALRQSGGVSIHLDADPTVATVAGRVGEHPWATPAPKPAMSAFPTGR